jgi:molybdenum cofactor biosynthesis enzyme MoaA
MDIRNHPAGWYFTDEEIATAKREEHPQMLNVSLYLGNACDINCLPCFTKEKKPCINLHQSYGKPLLLQEYYQLIDTCKQLGTKTINLVGAGEPTIDKNFRAVVSYIYQQNMKPLIATNGIALVEQPDLIDFLWENNATVVIKISSFDKDFQDVYVQSP